MKKIVTLLPAAALCLAALAACSGPSAGTATPADTTAAPQTAQVETLAPTSTPTPEPTPSPTPEPTPAGVLPEEDYAYFLRVGFGGSRDGAAVTAKWSSPLLVEVVGAPAAGDSKALASLVQELRRVQGMPAVEFVTQGGNVRIGYLPKKDGKQIDPQYNGTDAAQLFVKWNGDAPVSLHILISNELIGQDARDASLASLLLRGLGLAQDAQGEHADSALHPSMAAPKPSGLDWRMLSLLYHPNVQPGWTADEAMPVVRALEPADSGVAKSAKSDSFGKGELLEYFNEVGFYYKDESSPNGVASKWASPIKLQIMGQPSTEQKQMLDEYAARLNEIKGFPGISVVNAGGNFTVNFAPRAAVKKSFPKLAAAEACAFKITRAKSGAITGCAIGVDEGFADAAQARSQFLRLLIWSLGINFTSETWPDSILSIDSKASDWANLDWKMVELLYRQDVKAGAGRAAVMQMLGKALK